MSKKFESLVQNGIKDVQVKPPPLHQECFGHRPPDISAFSHQGHRHRPKLMCKFHRTGADVIYDINMSTPCGRLAMSRKFESLVQNGIKDVQIKPPPLHQECFGHRPPDISAFSHQGHGHRPKLMRNFHRTGAGVIYDINMSTPCGELPVLIK
ncbi:hypothetical protein MRX96_028316 [Rhipicephalus microplus]